MKPAELRRNLERADQMPAVRSDCRRARRLEWLVEHVEVVDADGQPIDRALLTLDRSRAGATTASDDPVRRPQRETGERPEKRDRRPSPSYHVPEVFEQTNRGSKSYDLFSRMLEENIIFLGTPIDDYVANAVCAQMLYLEYKNADKDISLYINCPGGDITALFAIYDTMKFVKNDISTFCYGQAASAAAVLLAGGTKGKRFALPHARILIHQPYGGAAGQAADIEIQAKEILRMRDLLNEMLAADTGQSVEKVARDTDRDFIMSADEAAGVRHHRRSDHHPRAGRRPAGCGRRPEVRGERAWPSSGRAATW